MAKIEMDISEYEIMKENKKLLEDSLKKERELAEEIKKLQQEKLKALEDAKMKVVKITRMESDEWIYLDESYAYLQIPALAHAIQFGKYRHGTSELNDIIKKCFKRHKTQTVPFEEITTHGLDEVKAELKTQIKDQIDKGIVDKLTKADKTFEYNNKLIEENKSLVSENSVLVESNRVLKERNEVIEKDIQTYAGNNIKFAGIEGLLRGGYTLWNRKQLLDTIIKIIKQ